MKGFLLANDTYKQDLKNKAEVVAQSVKDFKQLYKDTEHIAQEARKEFPVLPEFSEEELKQSVNRQGRYFSSNVAIYPKVTNFLDKYMGTVSQDPKNVSRRQHIIYALRDAHLKHDVSLIKATEKVKNYVKTYGFETIELSEAQANIRGVLPEDIRKFLPRNLIVETDPKGTISRITDRFGNMNDNIESKIESLKELVDKYNNIVDNVRSDLKNPNEEIRIGALITWIMLETGIRPGGEGEKTVKVKGGKDLKIKTFGGRGLLLKHVNIVSEDWVILDFKGKAGTQNIVGVKEPEAVKLLIEYADKALSEDEEVIGFVGDASNLPIFRRDNGVQFSEHALRSYFNKRVHSSLTPKNLRSLRATETVLSNLHKEQKILYMNIRKFVEDKVDDLQERITKEVASTIEKAIINAQKTLHHDMMRTTIDYYISPQVVLSFLSDGKIEQSLRKVILENKPVLRFDPNVFLDRALKKTASMLTFSYLRTKRSFTLLDILEDLKDSMKENGVI